MRIYGRMGVGEKESQNGSPHRLVRLFGLFPGSLAQLRRGGVRRQRPVQVPVQVGVGPFGGSRKTASCWGV